ncbi:MAG: hypothetical protein B6I19_08335 [Bacteroidetes bacterium 4572_114]|nr:MAG: hypothetical protein B6I19_08335 [Bacteroidetes bacterium 4572_114]
MKTRQIFKVQTVTTVIFLAVIFFSSCQDSNKLKESENGMRYKFHVHNLDSTKVNMYDIVEVTMNYRTADTILYEGGSNIIPFQINPVYEGDLMDGILLMHVGDSMTIILDAEGFFLNMMSYRELPPEIGDNKDLFFDIKLISARPEPAEMKADRIAAESRRDNEMQSIERFLDENGYDVEPTENGLYYIEVQEGTGKPAVAGKSVKVHYKGTFLNGEKFDSSYDRDEPIDFVLGQGQVIKGWDEGIAMMKEGGKANLVIPSKLAYGTQARGNIKPYSPLFFEVELVEVGD